MRFGSAILAAAASVAIFAIPSAAAPTMAFGYLENRSGDPSYQYLETIFPNAFANAIRNIFEVNTLKPAQINERLRRHDETLAKTYRPSELIGLSERIGADYVVLGHFVTLPHNRVTIRINLFAAGPRRIFSFTNTGAMETEIFKLVDRITAVMIDFLGKDNYFSSRPVPKGSVIGVITNLGGAELNRLFAALLAYGYRVSPMQGYDIYAPIEQDIERFRCVTAEENSYETVSEPEGARYLYGGWSGKKYLEAVRRLNELRRRYDSDYAATKYRTLDRMKDLLGIDALLIVGFNSTRTKAWARCVDVRRRELVWMRSNMTGGLDRICETLIADVSQESKKK